MRELFVRGGFLMWPLFICSIISLAVIIDRFLYFRTIRENSSQLIELVSRMSSILDFDMEVYTQFRESKGPISGIIKRYISFANLHENFTFEEAKQFLQTIGQEYVRKLEHRLHVLEVSASVAPLLGLLGTVTGIMKSFNILSLSEGAARAEVVSLGIAEALITTAFGLSISIVSIVFYSYFSSKVDKVMADIEKVSNELLSLRDDSVDEALIA